MINTLVDNGTIRLGYVSDNEATRIQFPIANTYALFGSGGDWYLLNRRPEDPDAYAVPATQITTDDDFLYWTLAAYDVAQYGNGECQLQYRIGDVVKMTQKWRTAVSSSLVDGGVVPTPYETWLDDLAEIAGRCEEAAGHYPYIGDNGDWYVWDVDAEEFVDTGMYAGGASYASITESGTPGNYSLRLDADTDVTGDLTVQNFFTAGNSAEVLGNLNVTSNATVSGMVTADSVQISGQGGDAYIQVQSDGSLNFDADSVTIGDNERIMTEPVLLYPHYDSDRDEWHAADADGTEYTAAALFDMLQAGRTFAFCDNVNYVGIWDGITYPMTIVEDVSSDYAQTAYTIATPYITTSAYDEMTNAFYIAAWALYAGGTNDTVTIDKFNLYTEDTKVYMGNTTANSSRRVLLSPSASDTAETSGVNKSNKLLFNPSSGNLTVNGTVYNKGINTNGDITTNANYTFGSSSSKIDGDVANGDLRLYADNDLTIASDNNISANANGDLTLNATGNATMSSAGGSTYVSLSDDGFAELRGTSEVGLYCDHIIFDGNPVNVGCKVLTEGFQWTAFSGTNGNATVTFTLSMSGSVPSSYIGQIISCNAGYAWNFCGEITAVNDNVVTVQLFKANWPTAGVDGVTTDWDPANHLEDDAGYLWLPARPDVGNYTIPGYRIALGDQTKANERGSITCGETNIADGRYSAAFGSNNKTGYAAFATGKGNIAAGDNSAALGQNNTIAAAWSTAVGSRHVLKRLYNFAAGYGNEVNTNFGMALGSNNKIGSDNTQDLANNSTAAGQHNTITNGVASFTSGDTNVVGSDSYASGQSIVVGQGNNVAQNAVSHYAVVLGKENTADGEAVIAIGTNNTVSAKGGVSIGGASVVSGSTFSGNTVSGAGAVAIGSGNTSSNVGSVALGLGNTAGGHGTFVTGKQNTVSGAQALVGGYSNTVSASQSGAIGAANNVTGNQSVALGQGLTTSTQGQVVVGKFNKADTNARFIVGNGTSASARANALAVLQNGDIIVNLSGTYYKLDLAALLAGGYLTAI